jgi:hypothetical protein
LCPGLLTEISLVGTFVTTSLNPNHENDICGEQDNIKNTKKKGRNIFLKAHNNITINPPVSLN